MSKKPRTTGEHIVALYGHITGLKKSITKIETNDLKHMHQDIDKLDSKFDKLTSWIVYGTGAVAIVFLTQILYIFSK
jgi:cob(I)alamin adenosyltransferase